MVSNTTDEISELSEIGVVLLDIRRPFQQLSRQERWFAHCMREAAFHGARIILRQVSPESETVFDLVLDLAKRCGGNWSALRDEAGIDAESMVAFLDYGAQVLGNLGNYNGYGDRKFVPRLEARNLEKLCALVEDGDRRLASVIDAVYSDKPGVLGYTEDGGMSNYYPHSPDMLKHEIKGVQDAVGTRISLRNTRLTKVKKEGKVIYKVLVASAEPQPDNAVTDTLQTQDGAEVVFVYGDHSESLKLMCGSLEKARSFATGNNQNDYLTKLISSYRGGDIEMHKLASVDWLSDSDPSVETWSGFLEPGRDPSGVRCEFEALVAMEDREWSLAFGKLSDQAMHFILQLPWSGIGDLGDELGPFENDVFVRPNFKGLNLLCYCVSNVWTGLTAPGYPDIKHEHGRKNLTFSNRVAAVTSGKVVLQHVVEQDVESFEKHSYLCFFLQLALHELIGHGCGKLLQETEPGVFNFNKDDLPWNKFTGEQVNSWYNIGETPESAFGGIATAYIECLAEGIGLYLMSTDGVLETLAPETNFKKDDVIYNAYLSIACMGLRALASYDQDHKKWGQVHDRARYGLLRCFLNAGDGFARVEQGPGPDPSLKIILDREKLTSSGRPALGDLIHKLQLFRSTKDVERGTKALEELTEVDDQALEWRAIVLAKSKERPIFLQANTIIEDDDVVLKEYPTTVEGLIQSWVDRVPC